MKGAFMFMSDLVKHLTCDVRIEFMAVSSYGNRLTTSVRSRYALARCTHSHATYCIKHIAHCVAMLVLSEAKGAVRIVMDMRQDIEGKEVLVVEGSHTEHIPHSVRNTAQTANAARSKHSAAF